MTRRHIDMWGVLRAVMVQHQVAAFVERELAAGTPPAQVRAWAADFHGSVVHCQALDGSQHQGVA